MIKNTLLKILLFYVLILLGSGCTPKREPETFQGMILFKKGQITLNSIETKKGDLVPKESEIISGDTSHADIQIIEPKTEVVIRVQQNSKLLFQNSLLDGKEKKSVLLKTGSALYNVESKLQKDEIHFTSPVTAIGVRGTKFTFAVSEEGNTKLHLLEGFAVYRLHIPEIENLPVEIISSNLDLKRKIEFIEKKEILLSQGEFIEIQVAQKQELLDILKITPELLQEKDPAKLQESIKNLQLPEDTLWKEKINSMDLSPTKMPPDEFQERLKEFSDLRPLKKEDLANTNSILTALDQREKSIQTMPVENKIITNLEEPKERPKSIPQPKKIVRKTVRKKAERFRPIVEEKPRAFTVQVGLFSNKENAERLIYLQLRFNHRIFIFHKEGKYCVQVGDFSSREEAILLKDKLKESGFPGAFVPN